MRWSDIIINRRPNKDLSSQSLVKLMQRKKSGARSKNWWRRLVRWALR